MKKKQQNFIAVGAGVGILLVSVLVTLYFSGVFTGDPEAKYQNVTMTNATLACEQRMHSEFDTKLSSYFVDSHSSRFDAKSFLYKIFLQAYTKSEKHRETEFFITCYVRSSSGRISKFEVFENKEQKDGEAIRRGGDKFIEWPQ